MNTQEQADAQMELQSTMITSQVTVTYPSLEAVQQAHDELHREAQVRARIYPRWLTTGQISKTEARERAERLEGALHLLSCILSSLDKLPM